MRIDKSKLKICICQKITNLLDVTSANSLMRLAMAYTESVIIDLTQIAHGIQCVTDIVVMGKG